MVAQRGRLPDLSTVVRRLRRRRHRGRQRHPLQAPVPRSVGDRRHLDQSVVPVAAARRGIRRGRLPRHQPRLRHAGRCRCDDRRGARPRLACAHRPRPQSLLVGPSMVQGRPGGRAWGSRARPVLVPRGCRWAAGLGATERLGWFVRGLGVGTCRRRTVVSPSVRRQPAGLELGEPGGARGVRLDPALLVRPRDRRLSHRRRRLDVQGQHVAGGRRTPCARSTGEQVSGPSALGPRRGP